MGGEGGWGVGGGGGGADRQTYGHGDRLTYKKESNSQVWYFLSIEDLLLDGPAASWQCPPQWGRCLFEELTAHTKPSGECNP